MQTEKKKSKKKDVPSLPIAAAWQKAAEELIENSGVLKRANHFAGKYFRKHFYPDIGNLYFEELLEYTVEKHNVGIDEIVKVLALDAATKTRWKDESHPPSADKIFATVLLILKEDFKNIPFSTASELILQCVFRQLRSLAKTFCEDSQVCAIDRYTFRTLMFAMKVHDADFLLPGTKINEIALKTKLTNVLKSVICQWEEFYKSRQLSMSNASQMNHEQLHNLIVNWGMPYTLFAMGTKGMKWGIENV